MGSAKMGEGRYWLMKTGSSPDAGIDGAILRNKDSQPRTLKDQLFLICHPERSDRRERSRRTPISRQSLLSLIIPVRRRSRTTCFH
jgi:hypothetical protein